MPKREIKTKAEVSFEFRAPKDLVEAFNYSLNLVFNPFDVREVV